MVNFKIEYNKTKNLIIKRSRGVDFEDVVKAVNSGKVIDDFGHKNEAKYPGQRMLIIRLNNYIYTVPYVTDTKRNVIFLKTMYANRKLNKKYSLNKPKQHDKNKK